MNARDQARETIANARRQADAIVQQARERARRIRDAEARRRQRNHERAMRLTQQTKATVQAVGTHAKHAVRLFRINLANTLTLLNGVSGFIAILAAVQHRFLSAAALILAGVFFDWLDGKAARRFGEETPLGAQLDSLSDLVTFGVAPAVFVAVIHPSFFAYFAGALFVLSAAVRLGRFNVQQLKGVYFGVPTTANGVLLPCFVYLGLLPSAFPWYLLVMALLMNAPLRIRKIV